MKKIIKVAALLVLLSAAAFCAYFMVFPDVSNLKKENPSKTALMEYREKQWAKEGKRIRIEKRWVPLNAVSPYLVKAVLIAEDDKFWAHKGFDYEAIQKALERDIKERKFKFGGSTISQQLVKNLYLSPSKNPVRKAQEALITWRLERNLSKRRILELYLNVVEWGPGVFGAESAANRHFQKPARDLTAQEAALLAAVLPNPVRYRADKPSSYVQRRARLLYSIMVRRGIVAPEYEDLVKDDEVKPRESPAGPKGSAEEGHPSLPTPDPYPAKDFRSP
jgi:monofunctional biosynthetic peptidoglycan transglycosylase